MRTTKGYSEEGSSSLCTGPDTCVYKPTDSRLEKQPGREREWKVEWRVNEEKRERECPIRPTQVSTYSSLCIPLTQRFIKQTSPFPKIHIETIFGQTRETKWTSCAVTGVWRSGRGGEAARRAASALVVSLQEPWKGKQAGAAMWAVTQERRTVKRETKRREKWLRSCHGLPACQCTCLLSGTRRSKGLNPESVNSYKHTPMYICTDLHTHSHTRTAVCPQSTCAHTHVCITAVFRSPSLTRLYADLDFWVELLWCLSNCNCDPSFQR